MARLNEPPVSTDSLETLRKKLLRQNRDLAKSNNVRALRIRELENDCACMLSENLELRSRILELEKEAEDNDARRIADHALAIKRKLESQLTEWGTLLAGLGLEPPMKKHSPRIRRSSKQQQRLSFSSTGPSPSQRRLRDIARDIEELGHISEHKSYPRRTLNPEQILALRSEAGSDVDSTDSPELGPPPMSKYIDEDPVKVDSPSQSRSAPAPVSSPRIQIAPPETLPSPSSDKAPERSPSSEKRGQAKPQAPALKPKDVKSEGIKVQDTKTQKIIIVSNDTPALVEPAKTGSKRKLAARDELENLGLQKITNENIPPKSVADKQSIRAKAGGKTLKELANMRKEARERSAHTTNPRKPLAVKSTNDDMSSPKKNAKPAILDEVAAAKADLLRSKASQERSKLKAKDPPPMNISTVKEPEPSAPVTCELGTPFTEQGLLSPSSPEQTGKDDGLRGGTPPPADINSAREPARLSRRSRTAVSYAEPNLRDKMRRPTKELYDAVTGEGKFARRSSQVEPLAPESVVKIKRESDIGDSWKKLPAAPAYNEQAPDSIPASPLAGKGSPPGDLPNSVATDRRKRPTIKEEDTHGERRGKQIAKIGDEIVACGSASLAEADVYEFTPSSPQPEKEVVTEPKKKTAGRKNTRRMSAAVHADEEFTLKERGTTRRRSMML